MKVQRKRSTSLWWPSSFCQRSDFRCVLAKVLTTQTSSSPINGILFSVACFNFVLFPIPQLVHVNHSVFSWRHGDNDCQTPFLVAGGDPVVR